MDNITKIINEEIQHYTREVISESMTNIEMLATSSHTLRLNKKPTSAWPPKNNQ